MRELATLLHAAPLLTIYLHDAFAFARITSLLSEVICPTILRGFSSVIAAKILIL